MPKLSKKINKCCAAQKVEDHCTVFTLVAWSDRALPNDPSSPFHLFLTNYKYLKHIFLRDQQSQCVKRSLSLGCVELRENIKVNKGSLASQLCFFFPSWVPFSFFSFLFLMPNHLPCVFQVPPVVLYCTALCFMPHYNRRRGKILQGCMSQQNSVTVMTGFLFLQITSLANGLNPLF